MASTSSRDVAIDGLINDLLNLKNKLNEAKVSGVRFSRELDGIRDSDAWKTLSREASKIFKNNDPEDGLSMRLEMTHLR